MTVTRGGSGVGEVGSAGAHAAWRGSHFVIGVETCTACGQVWSMVASVARVCALQVARVGVGAVDRRERKQRAWRGVKPRHMPSISSVVVDKGRRPGGRNTRRPVSLPGGWSTRVRLPGGWGVRSPRGRSAGKLPELLCPSICNITAIGKERTSASTNSNGGGGIPTDDVAVVRQRR